MPDGFTIDHKSFRATNVGRPAAHLIREALQNSMDENPEHIRVEVKPAASKKRGLMVSIIDDGPGFRDISQLWTIFASDKRDCATKRGRLGRGLKELLSVASNAVVITADKRVRFIWTGKTMMRKVSTVCDGTTGTQVHIEVTAWKKTEVTKIVEHLRLFIAPEGTAIIVNGVPNDRPTPQHDIPARLETVVYGAEGVPNTSHKDTIVRLLTPTEVGKWVYEMGIPVCRISDESGFEWSIDVQQRTPIRPERDVLSSHYLNAIYAFVANALMDQLREEELTDNWMENAVSSWQFNKEKVGQTYIERRFGQRAARAVVNDHDRNEHAAQDGVNVIHTQHVSANVRGLVQDLLPSTADLYPRQCAEIKYIPAADWTEGELMFVRFAKWVTQRLRLPETDVFIMDAPQYQCQADAASNATRIRVNRHGVGATFFTTPSLTNWVPLIAHELAHRTGDGHDHVFHRECENLSGRICDAVFNGHAEVTEMLLETK